MAKQEILSLGRLRTSSDIKAFLADLDVDRERNIKTNPNKSVFREQNPFFGATSDQILEADSLRIAKFGDEMLIESCSADDYKGFIKTANAETIKAFSPQSMWQKIEKKFGHKGALYQEIKRIPEANQLQVRIIFHTLMWMVADFYLNVVTAYETRMQELNQVKKSA